MTWHQALKKDETKNAPNESDLLTPRLLQLHPAGGPKLAVVLRIVAGLQKYLNRSNAEGPDTWPQQGALALKTVPCPQRVPSLPRSELESCLLCLVMRRDISQCEVERQDIKMKRKRGAFPVARRRSRVLWKKEANSGKKPCASNLSCGFKGRDNRSSPWSEYCKSHNLKQARQT